MQEHVSAKLSTRELGISFDGSPVLVGLNLDVPTETITAILGPSGCGKSVLLKCWNRLIDFFPNATVEGRALLDGKDVYDPETDIQELRRNVQMIFQQPNPLPQSIFDNVAYGPRLHGAKKREIPGIVEGALLKANLWKEVKDTLGGSALNLSGGQQQRLCIARALAVNPQVLLMDEPCSALDPTSSAKIEELMAQLKAVTTIVLVTHNVKFAGRVSEYMAFLYSEDAGTPARLIEFGLTKAMVNRPSKKITELYLEGKVG
jgi:phosphate transport system ATP-binding protein